MISNKSNRSTQIDIAVIITDKNKNIQWVNEGFTQITGYTLKDVVGKKPNTAFRITKDGRKAFENHIQALENLLKSQG